MSTQPGDDLLAAAHDLAERLRRTNTRIVFAESCTAGLIAATLSRIPGISEHLCGSAVVYRNGTKTAWLDVSADDLANESIGPVSEDVATAMATGVLEHTPEAHVAAAVTGHLGPDAPVNLDGVIVVGIARRQPRTSSISIKQVVRQRLTTEAPTAESGQSLREARQHAAALFVLQTVTTSLDASA